MGKLFALCFGVIFASAAVVPAATNTVLNTGDAGADTFRAALASATDGDVVTFATNVTGAITLTTGQLVVSNDVTIAGPGPSTLAVNGNAAGRVFRIQNASIVTITGLTITNGSVSGGGGIYNDHSTLTVSNCVVTDNVGVNDFAGGIFNDGQNGSASLVVVNSIISDNSSNMEGGGIFNHGYNGGNAVLYIINSTVSGNSSSVNGGGIFNNAFSSGAATLVISNSTFSGNSANFNGGAIVSSGSANANLSIFHSTITSNSTGSGGGGITHFAGLITLANTIVAGNTSAAGPDVNGTVVSAGFNLIGDTNASTGWVASDLLNTDPLLGPLADNGGPTKTHALLPGSPAVNAGDPDFEAPPAFDQRGAGFPRVQVGQLDIGAFESDLDTTLDPFPAHTDARDHLQDIADGVTDRSDLRKLNSAIHRLDKSSDDANWEDDTHFASRRRGTHVLNRDAIVARTLQRLAASNDSGLDTDELQDIIDQLVAAARILAQTAIDEASGDTTTAEEFLEKGDDRADAGDAVTAIRHYKRAWKRATSQ